MKAISHLIACVFVLALIGHTSAYSPATPYQHVVSNHEFFFIMLPTQYEEVDGEWVESGPPNGTAYQVSESGEMKKRWSVEGWYEFPGDVLLSADGMTLVRLREQFLLQDGTFAGDNASDALVTIYRLGEVIAEYSAKDLITDLKVGIRFDGWTGHKWLDRTTLTPQIARSEHHRIEEITEGETSYVRHPDVLQFATLEGTLFLIDIKSGSTLTKRPVEKEAPKKDDSDAEGDPFGEAGSPENSNKPLVP